MRRLEINLTMPHTLKSIDLPRLYEETDEHTYFRTTPKLHSRLKLE